MSCWRNVLISSWRTSISDNGDDTSARSDWPAVDVTIVLGAVLLLPYIFGRRLPFPLVKVALVVCQANPRRSRRFAFSARTFRKRLTKALVFRLEFRDICPPTERLAASSHAPERPD